jgi:integrase
VTAVEPWRLHDLRRTAATRMADLGTPPHVVEAVLNHVSGSKAGIAGIYNRGLYLPERRQALDLWGARVAALVAGEAGSNVVTLVRVPV